MSALIRHTNCQPQRPLWKTGLYLFGLIVGFQVILDLGDRLPGLLSKIVNSISVLALMASIVYLLKIKAVRYTYLLIEEEIIFYKQVGKKETKVLNVRIDEIEWLRPIQKMKRLERCQKTYILSYKAKGIGVYMGQFKKNNECYRFIIQPSQELYNEIQANIHKKKCSSI